MLRLCQVREIFAESGYVIAALLSSEAGELTLLVSQSYDKFMS